MQLIARRALLRMATALTATLITVAGTTVAASAQPIPEIASPVATGRPVPDQGNQDRKPAPKPQTDPAAHGVGSPTKCSEPNADGNRSCIEFGSRDTPPRGVLPQERGLSAAITPPQWCDQARDQVWATRTQACIWTTLTYTTQRVVNGQTTTTGEAQMTIMQYNYTDPGMGRYGHQIDTSMYSGWGDATKATIDGQGTLAGPCTRNGATFPQKPLSPANSWQTGESFYDTTATAPGATGTCETMWYLTFTNAPYSPAVTSRSMKEVRCDNATAGRPVVGCVVPWAASDLVYTRTATPELADHVAKAQATGLPSRLTRTENQTIIDSNRTKACGSAPSVPNKSCDEYPIASSHQGLNAGGTRRTHPGCGFTGVPAGTGPTGVSVCMIAAPDNNSQGGTNTQFFRRERVLENDPFNVVVR
ncbi:hypothetical protein [Streptomyces sp. G-G2]|uniref:NucA/NucB deoxyribonuclease domain-containing protein n=1 Tax=Streptomyces sp. G-G2 TaxID=3046201 RepID=UPI0024B8FA46|nr:hypothetical protein [Streptomyces sp. G-G2]MDJ0383215.1 hypothetical protein [Streptomyces sp. G-G2]